MLLLAQLYGHRHKDKIQILHTQDEYPLTYSQPNKTALLMCPSISPIYSNSPAFRLFAYNQKEGSLYNYTQYFMDLPISNGRKVDPFFLQTLFEKRIFPLRISSVNGTKYSRIDKVKFVEDSLYKNWRGMICFRQQTISLQIF